MEKRSEIVALIVVLLILMVFPVALLGYEMWRTNMPGARIIALTANVPENGGWQPDVIRVEVGKRIRLRITATDVIHGFLAPALGIQIDEILPGHVEEIEFTATRPGRYSFACIRWCSANHWRMRGIIEVVDPRDPNSLLVTTTPPLFQRLGVDIDAPHPAENVPPRRPSAARGALLDIEVPGDLRNRSPSDVFGDLRNEIALKPYSDAQLWDVIAFAWKRAAGNEAIERGKELFARDCAACHGESGKGDGPIGRDLPGRFAMQEGDGAYNAHTKRGPSDFTDASQMLGASDVLLQGKILRGGMGTGMPEWGTLYSDQDMWNVVSFIRSFVFDYGSQDEQ